MRTALSRLLYTCNRLVVIVAVPVLHIIAKDIGHFLHLVHIPAIIVTQGNDGGIFIGHAVERSSVAMPPAIVVDELFAVLQQVHTPAQAVIVGAGLFKAVAGISLVEGSLF